MRPRRALLLAIAVSTGCAHGRDHRPGDEILAGIKFEGNQRLSKGTLTTGLALNRVKDRGGAPDPYLVQIDGDRIRGEYLRKGYLDIGVRSRVERKGDQATVIYTVEEGERAATHVVITGLPDGVPVSSVRSKLPIDDGKPFDYESYDLAKPFLLTAVQDAGYAHAKLDASVIADRANRTATVALAFTPGPKCTFGNIEIAGAAGELATAVKERLAFAPGQVYSTQAIAQTQRNLYGFGRFSTVQVQPEQNAGEVVGVKVSVAESARHQIQLGGGFGVDTVGYEIRGRAGYSVAGWPFPLDTVSLDFRPAYAYLREGGYEPRIRALAKLERQDLLWTYTKGQIEAGYNYLGYEAFTSYGPLARLGFETPLGTDKLKLRVGWGIEQLQFRRVSPVIDPPGNAMISAERAMQESALRTRLGLDRTQRVAGYHQALVADLRDHPFEPRFGAYGELRATEGTQFAGGEFDYFELLSDVRGYVPLVWGVVLAGRARYGGLFGSAENIPVTERLYSGGAISQRGFGERRLSPFITGHAFDTKGNPTGALLEVPYGGTRLVETSIEARIPITTFRSMPVGVVTFLDGGNVVDPDDPAKLIGRSVNSKLWDLHWAAGVGLRVQTVVGPVRLDVGYRLNRTDENRDPEPGSGFAYHLTIGEAF